MDATERFDIVHRGTKEILVEQELRDLLARNDHPRAYIGYEPSGMFTVGQLVTILKVLDLARAGFDVTIFLADMHAFINDKLGGSLDRIREAGRNMETVVRAFGAERGIEFAWASQLSATESYLPRMLRSGKAMSLARAKRAMSIMGRKEEEADLDAAKLFYPAMQVADIFELKVDVALGGLDQRRAHVLAREVAQHYGWPVPIAIHTPLISSLKGGGRMDVATDGVVENKMSKSDPTSAIYVTDDEATIRDRIQKAFCPQGEVAGNPIVELARDLLFPQLGSLTIERPAKHGGPLTLENVTLLEQKWTAKEIHPLDLKAAVATGIAQVMAPARRAFTP